MFFTPKYTDEVEATIKCVKEGEKIIEEMFKYAHDMTCKTFKSHELFDLEKELETMYNKKCGREIEKNVTYYYNDYKNEHENRKPIDRLFFHIPHSIEFNRGRGSLSIRDDNHIFTATGREEQQMMWTLESYVDELNQLIERTEKKLLSASDKGHDEKCIYEVFEIYMTYMQGYLREFIRRNHQFLG